MLTGIRLVLLFLRRTSQLLSLHSFPTRRSSDLAGGFVLLIASWVLETRIRAERRAQAARGESTQDRKSTRLNSSHRCISYAVFCLKKKTAPELELARRRGHIIVHCDTCAFGQRR